MTAAGIRLCSGQETAERLLSIRRLYEPQVAVLSRYMALSLPHWIIAARPTDQWRKVADLRSDILNTVLASSGHLSQQSTAFAADLEERRP